MTQADGTPITLFTPLFYLKYSSVLSHISYLHSLKCNMENKKK